MKLRAITGREASIFAAVTDALLAPEPSLPPVRETDTVASFDDWLWHAPRLNRLAVRGSLYLLELAPLLKHGHRFRRLNRNDRLALLAPSSSRSALTLQLIDMLRMLAGTTYYGDPEVARRLGYDAASRVARGRELREREGRP